MAVDTEKTIRNQVLYSIYVRNYSEAGTFTAVQADLDRIKALGTDIIWLLPIQGHARQPLRHPRLPRCEPRVRHAG